MMCCSGNLSSSSIWFSSEEHISFQFQSILPKKKILDCPCLLPTVAVVSVCGNKRIATQFLKLQKLLWKKKNFHPQSIIEKSPESRFWNMERISRQSSNGVKRARQAVDVLPPIPVDLRRERVNILHEISSTRPAQTRLRRKRLESGCCKWYGDYFISISVVESRWCSHSRSNWLTTPVSTVTE